VERKESVNVKLGEGHGISTISQRLCIQKGLVMLPELSPRHQCELDIRCASVRIA
jgi:hypothetical protein